MVLVNNNVGLAGCNTPGAAKHLTLRALPCSDPVEQGEPKTGQEDEAYALIAGFRRKTISTIRRTKLDPAIAHSDKACRCDWTEFHGTEMVLAMGDDRRVWWSAETPPEASPREDHRRRLDIGGPVGGAVSFRAQANSRRDNRTVGAEV